jgi:heptose I phosphotransferase
MLVIPDKWKKKWKDKDVFEQLLALKGIVRKEKEGRRTSIFSLDGKNYYIKFYRGVGWKKIFRNLFEFRLPVLDADNEWKAIHRLERLGVNTMRPVGYGKRGWNPAKRQSFVITEELAQTVSLEDFCRHWRESVPPYGLKRRLIIEVAKIARALHFNGINHRDFYICHFLLDISAGTHLIGHSPMKLYLIDLHRVQIRRRVPLRWRVKDIAALYFSSMDLGLTQRDLMRFIRVYEGVPLKDALKKHRVFWWRVRRRAAALYRKAVRKGLIPQQWD